MNDQGTAGVIHKSFGLGDCMIYNLSGSFYVKIMQKSMAIRGLDFRQVNCYSSGQREPGETNYSQTSILRPPSIVLRKSGLIR